MYLFTLSANLILKELFLITQVSNSFFFLLRMSNIFTQETGMTRNEPLQTFE